MIASTPAIDDARGIDRIGDDASAPHHHDAVTTWKTWWMLWAMNMQA